jgi:hypothetical protein
MYVQCWALVWLYGSEHEHDVTQTEFVAVNLDLRVLLTTYHPSPTSGFHPCALVFSPPLKVNRQERASIVAMHIGATRAGRSGWKRRISFTEGPVVPSTQ